MKYIVIIMSIFYLMVSSLNAQENKIFVGVQGQVAMTDTESDAKTDAQTLANACSCTVTYTYEESTLSGRIFAGYKIAPKVSFEIGYFNTSSVEVTYSGVFSSTAWNLSQSVQASGLDGSVLFHLNDSFYLKGGLHSSRLDGIESGSVGGFSYTGTAEVSGSGFLAGIGMKKDSASGESFFNGEIVYYDSVGGISDATVSFLSVGYGIYF